MTMAAGKVTQIKMSEGQRADAYVVDDKLTVTRSYQTVSAAVAKKLLALEQDGKPYFQTREVDASDNEAIEAPGSGEGGAEATQ